MTSLETDHEAQHAAERLVTRLEQLHQTTLRINVASTIDELISSAATGAARIFGVPTAVLLARGGTGWIAQSAPNAIAPTVKNCQPDVIEAVIGTTSEAAALNLGPIGHLVDPHDGARGVRIRTPRAGLVGALIVMFDASSPEDAVILHHLSLALAVAVDNQLTYDLEHQIALTLQQAMLPQSLPSPAHLEVAARYQAASDTVEIGGDFYEVLELDEQTTLIAIGDVVGHSLQAATVMAELRYSLRAFASLELDPGEITERLGAILLASHPDLTATLCIAVIDYARRAVRVTNAGHVPPLIFAGGEVRFVHEHGPMLGLVGGRVTPTVTVPFDGDALLVLITDGLIERRRENIVDGLGRLAGVVSSYDGDVESLCDALLDTVVAEERSIDDIAIVCARLIHVA